MKAPKQISLEPEKIEELIDRLEKKSLNEDDYPLLIELIKGMVWLNLSLKEKKLSIKRLRAVFGIKTETASKLLDFLEKNDPKQSDAKSSDPDGNPTEKKKKKKGGSGHRPASDYTEARIIKIAHETLKKGDLCPDCKQGKLFNLSPGTVLQIVGAPHLQVEIYKPERLRCSLCGKTFTARLPQEIMNGTRGDRTAKAIVSLMKYRGGLPFYRQEQMQNILGNPITASELWKMTADLADQLLEIYAEMCHQAAQGKLLHNDDTTARILSIAKERKEKLGTESEEKRTGTFTTGIISILENSQAEIALFFTGRQHAGENMNDLLDLRNQNLPPPLQQCDGGHNIPKDHETDVSNCLAHARRKFYELADNHPKEVLKIIGWFAKIFANDKEGPPEEDARLKWHQEKSTPIMNQIKAYCKQLIETKQVEPNSSMGKAITYLTNQWEGLTLFLKKPGVPLTNNKDERLLKRAVLNRKNAYFYKTEKGANIGDILMSTIETCVLNKVNPWNYLLAIQEHQDKIQKNPKLYLPWNYQKHLKQEEPSHSQSCPPQPHGSSK
ncbi:IS66 family transposase [Candidatus Neptunochlamydia vexilliferae]|nr:IS66 family transposase [Candidatus Neptunochlamydia vexilliferae]